MNDSEQMNEIINLLTKINDHLTEIAISLPDTNNIESLLAEILRVLKRK